MKIKHNEKIRRIFKIVYSFWLLTKLSFIYKENIHIRITRVIYIFVITDLVNKINIYTNLIKLFHYEINIILFLFKSSIHICNNIWEYHLNKYIYNSSKKKWCEYACFPILNLRKIGLKRIKIVEISK